MDTECLSRAAHIPGMRSQRCQDVLSFEFSLGLLQGYAADHQFGYQIVQTAIQVVFSYSHSEPQSDR